MCWWCGETERSTLGMEGQDGLWYCRNCWLLGKEKVQGEAVEATMEAKEGLPSSERSEQRGTNLGDDESEPQSAQKELQSALPADQTGHEQASSVCRECNEELSEDQGQEGDHSYGYCRSCWINWHNRYQQDDHHSDTNTMRPSNADAVHKYEQQGHQDIDKAGKAVPPARAYSTEAETGADRYKRWVMPKSDGGERSDTEIVEEARKSGLLAGGVKYKEFTYATGEVHTLVFKDHINNKKISVGSVMICLSKGGTMTLNGSPDKQERCLAKVLSWTVPWNGGRAPTGPATMSNSQSSAWRS